MVRSGNLTTFFNDSTYVIFLAISYNILIQQLIKLHTALLLFNRSLACSILLINSSLAFAISYSPFVVAVFSCGAVRGYIVL